MSKCVNCGTKLRINMVLKLFFFDGHIVCPSCGIALEQDKSKMKLYYAAFAMIAAAAAAVAAIQRMKWSEALLPLVGVICVVAILFGMTVKSKAKT